MGTGYEKEKKMKKQIVSGLGERERKRENNLKKDM